MEGYGWKRHDGSEQVIYVHPIIELYNDAAHIRGLSKGLVIQKERD